MKYLFASDIHGSAYWCEKLIKAFENERAERLCLLGDILYHGPRNDLPEEYAPKKVAALLNGISESILCVKGNCEAEVDQLMLDFPVLAEYALLELDGKTIYMTHGHKNNIDAPLPMKSGNIMIYGHTHVPLDKEAGGIRFLNPGSVSIPKNNTGHGYILYEDGGFTYKEMRDL